MVLSVDRSIQSDLIDLSPTTTIGVMTTMGFQNETVSFSVFSFAFSGTSFDFPLFVVVVVFLVQHLQKSVVLGTVAVAI